MDFHKNRERQTTQILDAFEGERKQADSMFLW